MGLGGSQSDGGVMRAQDFERERTRDSESRRWQPAEPAAEHLARLQEFTSSLSEAAEATEIARVVVSVLVEEFGADTARVALPVDDEQRLLVLERSRTDLAPEEKLVSATSDGALAVAYRTGESRWVVGTPRVADEVPPEDEGASTIVVVPITAWRLRLGAVELVYRDVRHFGAADRALFDDYSRQIGLALDRARSYEEARRANARLQVLADVAVRIASAGLDLRGILDTAVRELTRTGFAQVAAVHVSSQSGEDQELAVLHDVEHPSGAEASGATEPVPAEVWREVARSGNVHRGGFLSVSRPGEEERAGASERSARREGTGTGSLTVPLRAGSGVTGTLTAARRPPAPSFSGDDEALLQELAGRAALSIENALLYRRAQVERARAEAASRAKDEFLAMLGHELRNPLSPILTAVHLMRLRGGDAFAKERTIIERQVNHMVRLVDDLLDVSRIARRKIQLKMAPVELEEVVANALEIASPALEERSHRLVRSIPDEAILVNADRHRLAQAIVNLLTNAARYTPPHGVIEVAVEARPGRAVLTVADNGDGIEPDLLPRIFELFVQGGQTKDRPRGGLGLGLAIAESLVDMHGGRLQAESRGPGQGSRFTLELPLLPSGRASQARASEPPMPVPTVGRRVLVVEDNVDAAEALAEFLEILGHSVRVAHDGPQALQVAREQHPEVALLDIGLPGMDGYELAERLTVACGAERPRLVALTGYGQNTDRERSRAAGFDEHLVKPVSVDRLQAVIAGEG